MPKADAVFEGGGVRGVAHVGALLEAEEGFGWQWQNVAGTSAGAIVAALVAAGYTAREIHDIIWSLDFAQLMDRGWEDRLGEVLLAPARLFPHVGGAAPYLISLFKDFGVYEGKRFLELAQGYLGSRGVHTYRDLLMPGFEDQPQYRYRLRVIAADVTAGRMLVLPDDIAAFGMKPDDLPVALSLRMSMSIPFFFEPVKLYNPNTGLTHLIVDGGILSNYPIWLFDAPPGEPIEWPTFGFNIYEPASKKERPLDPLFGAPQQVKNPLDLAKAIWTTVSSAMDQRYISKRHWARTISISSVGVGSTDFGVTEEQKAALLESGRSAARQFLSAFDFEEYKRAWRAPRVWRSPPLLP